jgi:hypothetical protein
MWLTKPIHVNWKANPIELALLSVIYGSLVHALFARLNFDTRCSSQSAIQVVRSVGRKEAASGRSLRQSVQLLQLRSCCIA